MRWGPERPSNLWEIRRYLFGLLWVHQTAGLCQDRIYKPEVPGGGDFQAEHPEGPDALGRRKSLTSTEVCWPPDTRPRKHTENLDRQVLFGFPLGSIQKGLTRTAQLMAG